MRKTVARALLLLVCLGLGVARPTLAKREQLWVMLLCAFYFGFGLCGKIQEATVAVSFVELTFGHDTYILLVPYTLTARICSRARIG